ncbi:hypothetical protein NDU88_005317 [Pleurodeles waltl]|uniref:Uncharacterized protein n=1 Tax=Pleurodeles waltl TaxID=8319 RepID=A0AAV7UIW1_PLEWA|nr:hypothetical protein NDU88_005317 [Pleurodeles waltl]
MDLACTGTAITTVAQNHTREPARKCPGGDVSGIGNPEVLPNPDIRVKDAKSKEDEEPERRRGLEAEEGGGTERRPPGVRRLRTETEQSRRREDGRSRRHDEGISPFEKAAKGT